MIKETSALLCMCELKWEKSELYSVIQFDVILVKILMRFIHSPTTNIEKSSMEPNTECPLCLEPFEMDDVNFFPCKCGYQVCRFCWHRIRTNETGLCPACRRQYPEDPANFEPLSPEEVLKIKNEKRLKDLQKKQKIAENRKMLSNLRIVQKNLVFVVGLPQDMGTDNEKKEKILQLFHKFGTIVKSMVNDKTSYAGSQGPSACAYITYSKSEDALKAIKVMNNTKIEGRTIKVSLGTTKYCSNFLRNMHCSKSECMYLHEMADEEASFTKEQIHAGKHLEYELKLLEQSYNNSPQQRISCQSTTTVETNHSQKLGKNAQNNEENMHKAFILSKYEMAHVALVAEQHVESEKQDDTTLSISTEDTNHLESNSSISPNLLRSDPTLSELHKKQKFRSEITPISNCVDIASSPNYHHSHIICSNDQNHKKEFEITENSSYLSRLLSQTNLGNYHFSPRNNHSPTQYNHSPIQYNHSPPQNDLSPVANNQMPIQNNFSPINNNQKIQDQNNQMTFQSNHSTVQNNLSPRNVIPSSSHTNGDIADFSISDKDDASIESFDDDLGFDPCQVSLKGLQDLLISEAKDRARMHFNTMNKSPYRDLKKISVTPSPTTEIIGFQSTLNQSGRQRDPPPGFSTVNAQSNHNFRAATLENAYSLPNRIQSATFQSRLNAMRSNFQMPRFPQMAVTRNSSSPFVADYSQKSPREMQDFMTHISQFPRYQNIGQPQFPSPEQHTSPQFWNNLNQSQWRPMENGLINQQLSENQALSDYNLRMQQRANEISVRQLQLFNANLNNFSSFPGYPQTLIPSVKLCNKPLKKNPSTPFGL